MMDYWLVFNLMLPFLEVIFHTYIELLNEEKGRIINHHGKARKVDSKEGGDKQTQMAAEIEEQDDKLFKSRNEESEEHKK